MPVPPFITSKLQQASRYPVKKTMMVAQQLYEGIQLPDEEAPVGLITYMRTDSVRVSDAGARRSARVRRASSSGPTYVPEQPNRYKVKSSAQDAHEAIRPTSMRFHPESVRAHLTPDQFYLYRLIWNRFVASQMTPATFDDTTVDITAADYLFRAKGSVPEVRRAGWRCTARARRSRRERADGKPGTDAVGARPKAMTIRRAGVLPALTEGQKLDRPGHQARSEVHAAAPAIQRRLARQGARRERHRPSEHVRVDHRRAPGARLREQDSRGASGRRSSAAGSSTSCCTRRSTTSSTSSTRRGWKTSSTRSKRASADYKDTLLSVLQEVREGPEARREGDAQFQGRAADRRDVRQVRPGRDGREGRQVRHLPRLQPVSRIATTPRNSNRPKRRPRNSRKRARTAASRW